MSDTETAVSDMETAKCDMKTCCGVCAVLRLQVELVFITVLFRVLNE